jgi:hypothetical protein
MDKPLQGHQPSDKSAPKNLTPPQGGSGTNPPLKDVKDERHPSMLGDIQPRLIDTDPGMQADELVAEFKKDGDRVLFACFVYETTEGEVLVAHTSSVNSDEAVGLLERVKFYMLTAKCMVMEE